MADDEEDDDLTADDELDPILQPKSAKAWWTLIVEAERVFSEYQSKCDTVDKYYANLERLANVAREREFQLFYANLGVLGPSIYSRPPVPVVVPSFRDRRPIPRTASELLERSCTTSFRMNDIDATMHLVRDDMIRLSRGVVWQRYETKDGSDSYEKVCDEYKHRRDFLHDPARVWGEVDWVAGAAYLTRREMRKRFKESSGDEYQNAAYAVVKDDVNGTMDKRVKAKVWELWSKSGDKVVWVAEGCDKLLDEVKPHLKLEGFFPCPRPAYGTLQPGTLIPIPEFVFWKDQAEEINEITARIASLTESLQLRGFYPAGAGEIGDAIEIALKSTDNRQVLVPISNWAQLGNGGAKDMIIWLPLDLVATTIQQLIELRKQLIDDVYQITGLSDIMRGSTVASETLGAQQLKSQYGSVRIKDRQDELIRFARDITRISSEIMAENFSGKTLLDMSQMEIPTNADIAKQLKPLEQQFAKLQAEVKQAATDPEIQQMAKQAPDKAKQVIAQAQQQAQGLQEQIGKLKETVTIEQVMKFLNDNKIRAFTLDIETDSTIAPDEDAQKQRATEYLTAMTGLLSKVIPTVAQFPQGAPLFADVIKFANKQFRVGREMEAVVDEFADQMKAMAAQPKGQDPAAAQLQADQQLAQQKQQSDVQIASANAQLTAQKAQHDAKLAQAGLQLDQQIAASNAQIAQQKNQIDAQKAQMASANDKWKAELASMTSIIVARIGAKTDMDSAALEAELQQILGLSQQQHEITLQSMDQQHQATQQDSQLAASSDAQQTQLAHDAASQEAAQQAAAEQAASTPA